MRRNNRYGVDTTLRPSRNVDPHGGTERRPCAHDCRPELRDADGRITVTESAAQTRARDQWWGLLKTADLWQGRSAQAEKVGT